MRDISTKTDGVDTLPAEAFNSDQTELENIVTSADITLDPNAGPDTDLNMLGKAVAGYANAGNIYQDSGTANSYVLSLTSNLKAVVKYFNNMMVVFKAGNSSTGASTINVNSLGSKSLTLADGSALGSNDIVAGNYVIAIYNSSDDRFEITKAVGTISDLPQVRDKSRNLKMSSPTVSTVDIDADEVVLQNTDSPPLSFVAQSVNLTVDITGSGANGLDTGSEAASTWYYLWVIFNGTTVAGLISTSPTAPTMPSGYTFKALVGAVRNDGSSDFIPFYQIDNKVMVEEQTAVSSFTTTWVSTDISAYVPATAKKAAFDIAVSTGEGTVVRNLIAGHVVGTTGFGAIGSGTTSAAQGYSSGVVAMYTSQVVWVKEEATSNGGSAKITGWEY